MSSNETGDEDPSGGGLRAPRRWNPWREWRPLIAEQPTEEYLQLCEQLQAIRDPSVRAVSAYVQVTSAPCLEFVFLANFVDATSPQHYPGGIVAVPCDDVLAASRSEFLAPPPRNEHIYDAAMPLEGADAATISAALAQIDESLGAISHVWGVSIRWVPKYIETVSTLTARRGHGWEPPVRPATLPLPRLEPAALPSGVPTRHPPARTRRCRSACPAAAWSR